MGISADINVVSTDNPDMWPEYVINEFINSVMRREVQIDKDLNFPVNVKVKSSQRIVTTDILIRGKK